MTCERCPREASIHLKETINGRRREIHLCAECAREAGLTTPAKPPSLPLESVLQTLILTKVGELVGDLAQRACPICGLKYMEYRGEGRLGCPNDYDAFATGLVPLLQRAHGATRHVGKRPARPPDADPRTRLRLRAQLRAAITLEAYEEAAAIRDQIRTQDADR